MSIALTFMQNSSLESLKQKFEKYLKKIPLKAETQNITSPALMSSSVKVVFHQGHLPLRSSSKVHHLEMMHARDQSIFLYLGSIMVA